MGAGRDEDGPATGKSMSYGPCSSYAFLLKKVSSASSWSRIKVGFGVDDLEDAAERARDSPRLGEIISKSRDNELGNTDIFFNRLLCAASASSSENSSSSSPGS